MQCTLPNQYAEMSSSKEKEEAGHSHGGGGNGTLLRTGILSSSLLALQGKENLCPAEAPLRKIDLASTCQLP